MSLTPLELVDDIKQFLIDSTRTMELGDERKAPGIYDGYLPRKVSGTPDSPKDPAVPTALQGVKNVQTLEPEEDKSLFPFVVLRATEFTDDDKGADGQYRAVVPIKLMFGTYAIQENGYREIMHLAQVIRLALIEKGIVGAAAEIQRPIRTVIHEDQPYPYWYGEMFTTWVIPTPTSKRKAAFLDGYRE